MLHAALISASSSAVISCSCASLERRGLAGCLPLATAVGLFLGGYLSVLVSASKHVPRECGSPTIVFRSLGRGLSWGPTKCLQDGCGKIPFCRLALLHCLCLQLYLN